MWSASSAALAGIIPFAISELAISSACSVIKVKGTFFWNSRAREKKIYFFKDKSECDFIVKTGFDVTEAIQVSATLSDAKTRHRELRGLTDCL